MTQTVTSDSLPRHLSASDSVAWRIEHNPLLRSTITLLLLLDSSPNHRALRAKINAATLAFPRLRQRVVSVPLHVATPVWAMDPAFDLDYHVRWIRAPKGRSYRGVLDLASAFAMQAFDRARPLWEWTVVDDLDGGRSAMIIKLHHSVTDGVGGMRLMSEIFDLERDAAPVRRASAADVLDEDEEGAPTLLLKGMRSQAWRGIRQTRKSAGQLVGLARSPLAGGQGAVRGLASTARLVAPARGPLSPLMTERSPRLHFESFTLPLAGLKAAARRADGKLNDAFMTSVAIGLRKYHEVHGDAPEALRVNMPINLRTDSSSVAGNNWAPARFVVPLDAVDVDQHMRDIHEIVAGQRAEPALKFANNIATVLDQLPTSVLTQVFSGMLTCLDFAATNVPGAPVPLYIAGSRVDGMEAFAPPSGSAVNFALLSYQDMATVALNIDPAAIPDPKVLLECTRQGFDAVINP